MYESRGIKRIWFNYFVELMRVFLYVVVSLFISILSFSFLHFCLGILHTMKPSARMHVCCSQKVYRFSTESYFSLSNHLGH